MSLYTEPPTGNISLLKLEAFALKRLDFLLKVLAAKNDVCRLHELVCDTAIVTDSDCLIPGSVKDKVSHFIIRLLMGGDPETQAFFCQAETALFDFHFSCMSEDEMEKFFSKIKKLLKKANVDGSKFTKTSTSTEKDFVSILEIFGYIRQSVCSWKEVVQLYMAQCSTTHFYVPFQFVLPLVRKRRVTLEKGLAEVPFSKLREVVTEQFSSLIQLAVAQSKQQLPLVLTDKRLKVLWRKLKLLYRRHYPALNQEGSVLGLCLEHVDDLIVHYPLCMSSLLRSLRQKHRLGHHARVQLTLFLKDLGLPVHHSVALWQQEYSQPSSAGSQCHHSWQSDSRRYTYSVRHLYGLEGARRNYQGHCCESLQQRAVGCGEEGGCPFSHWDNTALSTELGRLGLHSTYITDILKMRAAGNFSAACQRCLYLTEANRIDPAQGMDPKDFAVKDQQSCHHVDISSSPDLSYRTDYSMSDSREACDIEDLLRVDGMNPEDNETLACVPHKHSKKRTTKGMCGSKKTVCATERTFKRVYLLNQSEVNTDTSSCISDLEGSSSSSSQGQSDIRHSDSQPCLDQERDMPDKVVDSCELPQEPLIKLKSLQYWPPANSENQRQKRGLQCCDHNPCPSQVSDISDQSLSTRLPSHFPFLKPAHYVHISYQHLLQNLKSC